jgi:hypothetical protein
LECISLRRGEEEEEEEDEEEEARTRRYENWSSLGSGS